MQCSSSFRRGFKWQKIMICPISIKESRPRASVVSWFVLFLIAMTCSWAILLTNLQIIDCCCWPWFEFLGWTLGAISISQCKTSRKMGHFFNLVMYGLVQSLNFCGLEVVMTACSLTDTSIVMFLHHYASTSCYRAFHSFFWALLLVQIDLVAKTEHW